MASAEYEMVKRGVWRSLQEYWIQWRTTTYQLEQLDQSLQAMELMQEWMRSRNDAMVGLEDQYTLELELLSMQIEREKLRENLHTLSSNMHQQLGDSARAVRIPLEPLVPLLWMPDSLPAALGRHPELQMQQTTIDMESLQEAMVKVSGRPMIGLGLQYSRLNPMGGMSEGADMIMPMVQLNLPLGFSKRNAAIQMRRTQREALETQRLALRQQLEIRWRQARTEYRQALRLGKLYQQQRELAYERYQLRLSGYRVGKAAFDELLQSLLRYHDAVMKDLMALQEQHLALADLEEFVGSIELSTQE